VSGLLYCACVIYFKLSEKNGDIMEIYDVVHKLIGNTVPIGESNTDDLRFENLKALALLVDKLIYDIEYISRQKNRVEYSISRAGKFCDNFLEKIALECKDR